jgi:uncharacterized membrane protein YraQ (UPF0718 family)
MGLLVIWQPLRSPAQATAPAKAKPALGTTLAFMMPVIAISFPKVVILRKVLKPKLIAVFIGVVAVGEVAKEDVAARLSQFGG